MIRHLIDAHTEAIPSILEIPGKDNPYDASKDSILRRAKVKHLVTSQNTYWVLPGHIRGGSLYFITVLFYGPLDCDFCWFLGNVFSRGLQINIARLLLFLWHVYLVAFHRVTSHQIVVTSSQQICISGTAKCVHFRVQFSQCLYYRISYSSVT